MRRRWLIILAVLATLLVTVCLFLPWWLPLAARVVATRFGATFARYERVGYSRFALVDVRVRRPGVDVAVKRVEADTPLLWSWRHLRGAVTPVVASEWSVEVQKRATSPSEATPATNRSGWMPLRAQLQRIARGLDRWLPRAVVGPGIVRWPGGQLSLSRAHWQDRTLAVQGLVMRGVTADGTVTFSADDAIRAKAEDAKNGAMLDLQSRGAAIEGTAGWWNQRGTVAAKYDERGWLPAEAEVDVANLNLPADRLKLSPTYVAVTGRMHVGWREGEFAAEVNLRAEPAPGKPAPALGVTFSASGNPHRVTVNSLQATIPGGTANLSAPLTIEQGGNLTVAPAEFSVRMDLSRQPWGKARGIVTGTAHVVKADAGTPRVDFVLGVDDVALQPAAARRIEAAGRLAWPSLSLERVVVTGLGGEQLQAHGAWNFREKLLRDAAVRGTLLRPTVARWLSPSFDFERMTIDAQAEGPLATLTHGGTAAIEKAHAGKVAMQSAIVTWHGSGSEIAEFSTTVDFGLARVAGGGSASRDGVNLTQLSFADRGSAVLALAAPTRITWRPALTVTALRLAGADASLDANLVWGEAGRIEVAVRGIQSRWIADVFPLRGPQWTIPSFAVTGTWSNGPMTYSTAGALSLALPENRTALINVSGKGSANGLVIEALHAVESGNAVVNASGQLPITIHPGAAKLVVLEPDGKVVLDATTVPNAAFWQQLAAMTGVELRSPQVEAHVTGTWTQPQGVVQFRVDHAAMDPKRFSRPIPTVEAVDVALVADNAGIRLDRFTFTIERQLVRATGRLPVDRTGWRDFSAAPMAYLQQHADLRIEVPDAEVAMFSRFLPAALAPAGRLQADIRFEQGGLGGFLRLRDAASRPLGPLGVLQQVNADVDFRDHRVELRQVTATSGGQPVTLSGTVELPSGGLLPRAGAQPRYDVALKGKNLPFVRQAGLLMRGDLDLKLQTPAEGAPAIRGTVVLRDSLFLTDVRAFLPHGGGASPSRRPPYFAVETAPLNTWGLDIDVVGNRFLRIRTPVFAGIASSHFHLGGTLGEPRALGDARIDEGQVLMPFATFQVKQGAVRLTEENPYEPTIYLRGTGRHYGYDLAMEVTGKASSPNIMFTSSPALDSDQVLLMVMTGAAPANEVNTSLTHRAVQIGAFFGQSLVGSLTGGTVEPDRLTLESGEKISAQGRETYSIEYKLSDRWSVTGEYDEFDQYNAGFKWRVAPKKTDK